MSVIGWMLALSLLLVSCAAAPIDGSQEPTPEISAPAPGLAGLSRDEALDAARDVLRETGQMWEVVSVEFGPLEELMPEWRQVDWGDDLSADLEVWRVRMASGDLSALVLLDFRDGSLYASVIGIAN